MGFHSSLLDMLCESLPEYVAVARLAVTGRNPDGPGDHCYGYPAGMLLLAIADTIGSCYRGNRNLVMKIDGGDHFIDGDKAKHFYVLNSVLYGQSLSSTEIQDVYDDFRDPLTHNGSLVAGRLLNSGVLGDPVFYSHPMREGVVCINLTGLLSITERAVCEFLKVAHQVIPGSYLERTHAKKSK